VLVKGTGYVTGARAAAGARLLAHLTYIRYRARAEDEGPRAIFDAGADALPLDDAYQMILDQGRDGLRFHKIVLSPATDERVVDWPTFTRQVMADLGRRLGLELTWCATVHQNTDNPHVHIVLAGDGQRADGRVVQARLYRPHYDYLRERALWHTDKAWDQQRDTPRRQDITRTIVLGKELETRYERRNDTGWMPASDRHSYSSSGGKANDEVQSATVVWDRFYASIQTATSQMIVHRIEAGELKVEFVSDVDRSYGSAGGVGSIVVSLRGPVDRVLSTLVHEGQHELDITSGRIPNPEKETISAFARALAEGRARFREAEFAGINNLVHSPAFTLYGMSPIAALESIIRSNRQLADAITDDEFRQILEQLNDE